MGYSDWVNRFSTTLVGGWIARKMAPYDPLVYRATGGRLTLSIVKTIPQLALTTIGRKSGRSRAIQLGCLADGDDFIVVATNFGQRHHPAWSYNLMANPAATVEVDGRVVPVVAERLSNEERDALWPRLDEVIPQFAVYRSRTDRDIRVFRLRPVRKELGMGRGK